MVWSFHHRCLVACFHMCCCDYSCNTIFFRLSPCSQHIPRQSSGIPWQCGYRVGVAYIYGQKDRKAVQNPLVCGRCRHVLCIYIYSSPTMGAVRVSAVQCCLQYWGRSKIVLRNFVPKHNTVVSPPCLSSPQSQSFPVSFRIPQAPIETRTQPIMSG